MKKKSQKMYLYLLIDNKFFDTNRQEAYKIARSVFNTFRKLNMRHKVNRSLTTDKRFHGKNDEYGLFCMEEDRVNVWLAGVKKLNYIIIRVK